MICNLRQAPNSEISSCVWEQASSAVNELLSDLSVILLFFMLLDWWGQKLLSSDQPLIPWENGPPHKVTWDLDGNGKFFARKYFYTIFNTVFLIFLTY